MSRARKIISVHNQQGHGDSERLAQACNLSQDDSEADSLQKDIRSLTDINRNILYLNNIQSYSTRQVTFDQCLPSPGDQQKNLQQFGFEKQTTVCLFKYGDAPLKIKNDIHNYFKESTNRKQIPQLYEQHKESILVISAQEFLDKDNQ